MTQESPGRPVVWRSAHLDPAGGFTGIRADGSVSLCTYQALDLSFPLLALSLCFHTQFSFYPTNTGFPSEAGAGMDLLHSGIIRRERFPA